MYSPKQPFRDGSTQVFLDPLDFIEIGFTVHPHMLRHATGYSLANDGQDTQAIQHYLGHKNIQHTVRYTELSPDRFKDFWKD